MSSHSTLRRQLANRPEPLLPPDEPMAVVAPTVTSDRGNPWVRRLLALFGWQVRYHGTPPGCGVIVAYPHTSSWDFVIGIVAKWAIGLPAASTAFLNSSATPWP